MRTRPRRWPGYLGFVFWGFFIWYFGFLAFNWGSWWGLAFGAMSLALLTLGLCFYGVIPLKRTVDDERA